MEKVSARVRLRGREMMQGGGGGPSEVNRSSHFMRVWWQLLGDEISISSYSLIGHL